MRKQTATDIVLVVDEAEVRESMNRSLADIEHEVVSAASHEDALAVVDSQHVAVAVCGVSMSGPDLSLVEQLRRRSPDTAVILLADVPDLGSAARGLGLGVVDYVSGPVAADRLQEAVRRAF